MVFQAWSWRGDEHINLSQVTPSSHPLITWTHVDFPALLLPKSPKILGAMGLWFFTKKSPSLAHSNLESNWLSSFFGAIKNLSCSLEGTYIVHPQFSWQVHWRSMDKQWCPIKTWNFETSCHGSFLFDLWANNTRVTRWNWRQIRASASYLLSWDSSPCPLPATWEPRRSTVGEEDEGDDDCCDYH